MAIIKLGPVVSDIRGSIGGTTFARNPAGAYARSRTKPIYPGSDAQAARAAQMSQVVQTWQATLTVGERLAWAAKTSTNGLTNALGDRIEGSGFNLYARANLLLLLAGQTMVVPPPTPLTLDAPVLTLAWSDGDGIRVTDVHGWTGEATDYVILQDASLLRQTINFHAGPWDRINVAPGTYYRAVPASLITDAWLQSDTRSFLRFRVVNEAGAVSQAWIQHADVGTISA